jgi:8-amino-7-oxononanoate synthase
MLCSPIVRHYLINYARPLIYTTFLSFPSLAAIRASYSLLESGYTEPLQTHLHKLVKTLFDKLQLVACRHELTSRDSQSENPLFQIPQHRPRSSIFSLRTPYPRELAKYCQSNNMVVRAVVPPTVPTGTQRIRICLHAGNSAGEIERLILCIEKWIEEKQSEIETGEPSDSVRARL